MPNPFHPQSNGRDTQSHIHNLLSEARHDSDRPLGELWERFREFLLMTAEIAFDLGIRPKIGASDLVQESMIEALRDFPRFKAAMNPSFAVGSNGF